MPSFDELKYNASLLFANSHDSYSQSIKLPANCKLVGGYHIDEDVAPLPQASIFNFDFNKIVFSLSGTNKFF